MSDDGKRFFVLELAVDTDFVRVLEVTREFTADPDKERRVEYHRRADADAIVYGSVGPRFYGKLDALLVTKTKIEAAAPIIPIPPREPLPVGPMGSTVDRVARNAGLDMVPDLEGGNG